MLIQTVYLVLCVIGTILPYSQFIPYLQEHGLNPPAMFDSILSSYLSRFAWADVIISAIALLVFVFAEGRRLRMKHLWLPVVGLGVGVSLSLPLFLYMRELHLAKT